ncbi:uncharacterized protein LOC9310143 isoform X2 [Arabidopsis lyrata subsp. lyrata]|uniref:uncharacterized protein LOC9310143 isoform X2 n=1 Tax=Arabidopsis lyrata subsp. lyrata TaxID=81972 RepID=UPI000A29D37B|nr:uncharacterized protein LOC9310143 isoform X2 [Arabidopsis lyrata subsp. lyrata]|eukprot:XP_020879330.1 uncharacterized protein LOC9310143 isoform X2 [Arabidopsis lyrata subsp. lyrata]
MKMMLFTVLGSFIVGASLLLLLLFLIYLLRELCYEGIEVYKEARGEEEHLISPSISDESEYQCAQSAEQLINRIQEWHIHQSQRHGDFLH